MTKTAIASGTRKVRRRAAGGKRAEGWSYQRRGRQVRRPDPRRVRRGAPDARVTGFGGLLSFNAFTHGLGLHRELREHFGHLKSGHGVVYPMDAQMQLLIDAAVCGASRVFGLEMLAADALFTHLCGGSVPSIDTVYDDLRRFNAEALESLEQMVSRHGLAGVRRGQFDEVHLDVDTTVTPLFGEQEGANLGSNPHFHARPSYHPILARVAELGTVVAARLRPGDTSLGVGDIEDVQVAIRRVRKAVGPKTIITVRIDAGGECTKLLEAVDAEGCFFVVKAKQNSGLLGAVAFARPWIAVDHDAEGRATREVAEVDYQREEWPADGRFRVFAVRTTERQSGRQTCLWPDLDHSVHVYVTNDLVRDADELARTYDLRAGIEPLIGELKGGFGIGKMSSSCFFANEAAFLLKILAFNLVRRWIAADHPPASCWRMTWIRDVCVRVPGRLLRHGRQWIVRLAPRPILS